MQDKTGNRRYYPVFVFQSLNKDNARELAGKVDVVSGFQSLNKDNASK